MTLLLMTLEWFPLIIVQVHLHSSFGGEAEGRLSVPSLLCQLLPCKRSSSHTGWAGCGNQITAWALAVLAKIFPSYAWGEKEATKSLVSNQLMLQHWSSLRCGVHEDTFYRDITLAGDYSGTKKKTYLFSVGKSKHFMQEMWYINQVLQVQAITHPIGK